MLVSFSDCGAKLIAADYVRNDRGYVPHTHTKKTTNKTKERLPHKTIESNGVIELLCTAKIAHRVLSISYQTLFQSQSNEECTEPTENAFETKTQEKKYFVLYCFHITLNNVFWMCSSGGNVYMLDDDGNCNEMLNFNNQQDAHDVTLFCMQYLPLKSTLVIITSDFMLYLYVMQSSGVLSLSTQCKLSIKPSAHVQCIYLFDGLIAISTESSSVQIFDTINSTNYLLPLSDPKHMAAPNDTIETIQFLNDCHQKLLIGITVKNRVVLWKFRPRMQSLPVQDQEASLSVPSFFFFFFLLIRINIAINNNNNNNDIGLKLLKEKTIGRYCHQLRLIKVCIILQRDCHLETIKSKCCLPYAMSARQTRFKTFSLYVFFSVFLFFFFFVCLLCDLYDYFSLSLSIFQQIKKIRSNLAILHIHVTLPLILLSDGKHVQVYGLSASLTAEGSALQPKKLNDWDLPHHTLLALHIASPIVDIENKLATACKSNTTDTASNDKVNVLWPMNKDIHIILVTNNSTSILLCDALGNVTYTLRLQEEDDGYAVAVDVRAHLLVVQKKKAIMSCDIGNFQARIKNMGHY
ncbi:hypothetical protein RFI_16341 [Reticulomyxa filosa]|uniref:IFT140 first beta-propeller domain-containing protein n=1 Tax=Reticulomyxa filosa TaxID=46433 RepID=X6N4F8_RETFI|nr:hypothetical protein RFI_16341 [Reticulomyxa filosa]|eukprot:ETO20866.1 hypothetical protein RFI_16341 [Reticulomyxa filosa]